MIVDRSIAHRPLEDLAARTCSSASRLLHGTIGLPWAWSIVALTIIVRIVARAADRPADPLDAEPAGARAGDEGDPEEVQGRPTRRQNEELMKFYRENNINPAASCLPMLAQFPVFISLFFVLQHFATALRRRATSRGSASSRTSPTRRTRTGRATCCSSIYAASQLASTLLHVDDDGQDAADPAARPADRLHPFIVNFPAGLILYWMTTNLWTVGPGPRHAPARAADRRAAREALVADAARRTSATAVGAGAGAAAPRARRSQRAATVKRKKRGARR